MYGNHSALGRALYRAMMTMQPWMMSVDMQLHIALSIFQEHEP